MKKFYYIFAVLTFVVCMSTFAQDQSVLSEKEIELKNNKLELEFAKKKEAETGKPSVVIVSPEELKKIEDEQRKIGNFETGIASKKTNKTNVTEKVNAPVNNDEKSILKKESIKINYSIRESDVYKSEVIANYFSADSLDKLRKLNPDIISKIGFYFNQSFMVEPLEVNKDQKKVDEFVKKFDPYKYEMQRKQNERTDLEFKEEGVKIVLLSESELPFKLPKKIRQAKGQCVNCGDGFELKSSTILKEGSGK